MTDELRRLKKDLSECKNKRLSARVTSVARSGMSRNIHFVGVTKYGRVFFPTHEIARILGLRYRDSDDSLHISGCGMDMIFHVLYRLNSHAIREGAVRRSAKKSGYDLQYHGIVDTSYNYI